MKPIRLAAAALLALSATSIAASALTPLDLDLKPGGQPKITATKIQLAIKGPADNACPGTASFNAWVFSNKAGTVPILVVRRNGSVGGPYEVETVKGANGLYMGVYSQDLNLVTPIDAEYRIVTPLSDAASNWVPLKASC